MSGRQLIRMRGIVKRFYVGQPNELEILHGIDLDVNEGEFVSIVGASGSGKSTLMNMIGVLDRPTEGTYWLDGTDVEDNVFETLLSIVPSILVGTLFGFLLSKRIGGGFAVFFVSLLQFALNFGMAKLLEITISINPIDLFFDLFRIEKTERTLSFVPAFVMALSFLQTSISNFFVMVFAYRLPNQEANCPNREFAYLPYLAPCLGILFSSLALGIGYINLLWGSLLLCFSIYFGILSIASFRDEKRWWIYVLLFLCYLGVFFLRAALSSHYEEGVLFYALFTLPLDFLALVSNLLKRKDKDEVS